MIPKVAGRGHSFKGIALYLMNNTAEMEPDDPSRVDWTQTVNLMTDDIEKAAKVMAWTDMHADDLKAAAGVSTAGAKQSAGAVYHYTLAWAVGEDPSPEHMKQAVKETIEALGLSEHQYFMAAHNDRPHRHVHVVVNLTHPETGKRAELGRDQVKLQKWALGYEREHGLHCEAREINAQKREQGQKVKYQGQKQDYSRSVTRAFELSDDGKSFVAALEREGLHLARSRRGKGYVIVDAEGDIQKLGRQLDIAESDRAKTAAIHAKLADIDRNLLPDGYDISNRLKEQAKEAAELEAQSFREAQEAAQQTALLEAADAAAAQKVQQEQHEAFLVRQEIKRAEASYNGKMRDLETRQAKETATHEKELRAFYGPRIDDLTRAADELQKVVHGRGVRFTLRRLWRGRQDREELERLRRDLNMQKDRMLVQRRKMAAAHQVQRDDLTQQHRDRVERLEATIRLERFPAQRSPEQETHRLISTGPRVSLETAKKRRDKAIRKRAYELKEAEEARQAALARQRALDRLRPEAMARLDEIRAQQPDAAQRQSEGPQETSGTDKGKGKDKGFEFEP
jgi:hypothetical protein